MTSPSVATSPTPKVTSAAGIASVTDTSDAPAPIANACKTTISADLESKPAIGVCVAGGGGGGAPACCASLDKVLSICGFDVVDMLPVRRQNLDAKLAVLEQTGARLAK